MGEGLIASQVLGCCIVIVFLIGLVKLWHTNRELRKHEIIDEERRARIAEMKHCGIRHLSYSNVPFGVRAIERGVEVDGIWIASTGTAETSQVASTATLIANHTRHKTLDEETCYENPEEVLDNRGELSSSTFTHSPAPSSRCNVHRQVGYCDSTTGDLSRQSMSVTTDGMVYKPSGTGRLSLQDTERAFIPSPQQLARHRPRTRATSLDSSAANHPQQTKKVYGSAQIFVNREHRRLNSGFEVLPVGALGVRPEFPVVGPGSRLEDQSMELQTMPTSTKLQKQRR